MFWASTGDLPHLQFFPLWEAPFAVSLAVLASIADSHVTWQLT